MSLKYDFYVEILKCKSKNHFYYNLKSARVFLLQSQTARHYWQCLPLSADRPAFVGRQAQKNLLTRSSDMPALLFSVLDQY
jgi:hypothetical protein